MSNPTLAAWYPERPPAIQLERAFTAYVFGSRRPNGMSASIALIYDDLSVLKHKSVKLSAEANSNEYRAVVAAFVAVVEALPPNSTVCIRTCHEVAHNAAIQWLDKWKTNDLRNSTGNRAAAIEIWMRFDEVRTARQIKFSSEFSKLKDSTAAAKDVKTQHTLMKSMADDALK